MTKKRNPVKFVLKRKLNKTWRLSIRSRGEATEAALVAAARAKKMATTFILRL